jgi:hypothetical protein
MITQGGAVPHGAAFFVEGNPETTCRFSVRPAVVLLPQPTVEFQEIVFRPLPRRQGGLRPPLASFRRMNYPGSSRVFGLL